MSRTLTDFLPVLRDGCEHLHRQGVCGTCAEELADQIDHLLTLMVAKYVVDEEIQQLEAMRVALPIGESR